MSEEKNIPDGWEKTTLVDVTSLLGDGLHGTPQYSDDGEYYFINGNNLNDGKIEIKPETKKCSIEEYNKYKKKLNDRTILVSINGSLGYFAYYNNEKCFLGKSACYFNVKENIDKRFIGYQIRSKYFQKYIERLASGTTIKNVSLKTMREFSFLIPKDIDEQKSIADILTALDNKIEVLQAQNKTLEETAQTIFAEWFGKYSVDDELPDGWSVETLGNEFDITIGRTPPRIEQEWFSNIPTGKKWISIKDIGNSGTYIYNTSEYLTDEAIEKFNIPIIPKNTTVLSFKMTVGKLTITTEDMLSNEAIAHLKIKANTALTTEFIYLYLQNLDFNALGSTSSIVIAINSTMIKAIEVVIPKKDILIKFNDAIKPLFNKIKLNTEQINSLTQTRDELLPRLMSGEVRVKM
jgi:type I restriction enzyme S subunit